MKGWKRALLVAVGTAPIAIIVFSMLFMARSEMAFDESTCPFDEGELRVVAQNVSVREDARTCQPGVEEHRWVLQRAGQAPREMARRRLEAEYFEGDYRWTATIEDGEVEVEIHNPGFEPRVFREHAEITER